jgi:hypothetical protein
MGSEANRAVFAPDQATSLDTAETGRMASLVFTCPTTKLKVQHWLDDDEDAQADEYQPIICQACTWMHFINRKTGQLLGKKNDSLQAGGY